MPFIPHRSSQYSLISQSQEEESLEPGSSRQTKAWHRTVSIYTYCVGFALMAIVCFVLGYVLGKGLSSHISPAVSTCTNPITRHEWRTLSVTEKDDYIAAVQCLRDRPSRLGLNQTLYDDFPWLHAHIGLPSHFSAGFLSWHRYFIHIYESTLQRQCDFQGHLAYWDWSLDWEDISKSPVFDPSHGFGGDGNATGETTVGHGRCVIDGPFNGLVVPVFGSKDDPHCLSRGFLQGEAYNTEVGSKVKPSAIDSILDAHNYQDFNLGLEDGPHLGIPFGVRGDFLQFTAPYDPSFFLHHTQVDRLWWIWQNKGPSTRFAEYFGITRQNTSVPASLTDILSMDKFASSVTVADIMSTESELLCYKY